MGRTVSLYGHAAEIQVSRWGLPMITHLFLNDPGNQEVKETFNKSVPPMTSPYSRDIIAGLYSEDDCLCRLCHEPGRIRKTNGLSTMPGDFAPMNWGHQLHLISSDSMGGLWAMMLWTWTCLHWRLTGPFQDGASRIAIGSVPSSVFWRTLFRGRTEKSKAMAPKNCNQ